jgi:hypothetical protein
MSLTTWFRSAQDTVRTRHSKLNRIAELLGFAATNEPAGLGALDADARAWSDADLTAAVPIANEEPRLSFA